MARQKRGWSAAAWLEVALSNTADRLVLLAPLALALGIALWFGLPEVGMRRAALMAALAAACASAALSGLSARVLLAGALLVAAGMLAAEWRSARVAGPMLHHRLAPAPVEGVVEALRTRAGAERVQILLRRPGTEIDPPHRVRVTAPLPLPDGVEPGARIRVRAMLGPVPGPVLPGGHDAARAAWFEGVAASGRALAPPEVLERAPVREGFVARLRARIEQALVRALPAEGSAVAVALVLGEQGRVAPERLEAWRVAGMVHLLTVSGFHVGVVVGAAWFAARSLAGLWPWLVLRIPAPLVAAPVAGLAGTGYALLSGAGVPAVRAALLAWLVLAAMMLGRRALSPRLLAAAACLVAVARPEAVLGPSFQMSFVAVAAILLVVQSPWGRALSRPGEAGAAGRLGRRAALLLLTSLAVELALTPVALVHFGRSGVYGVAANMLAIPWTGLVVMPLLGGWLGLSMLGLGGAVAWLLVPAIGLLGMLAEAVAAVPGAVWTVPAVSGAAMAAVLAGVLVLLVLRGALRWAGAPLLAAGLVAIATAPRPGLLVSGDGRQAGIVAPGPDGGPGLWLMTGWRGGWLGRSWQEAVDAPVAGRIADLPGSRCGPPGCLAPLPDGARLLVLKGPPPASAPCGRADVVVAPVTLKPWCRGRWLTLDAAVLKRTGPVAIDTRARIVRTLDRRQGDHPWASQGLPGWRPRLLGPPVWTGVIAE